MEQTRSLCFVIAASAALAAGKSIVVVPGGDGTDDLALAPHAGQLLSLDIEAIGDQPIIAELWDAGVIAVSQSNPCDGGAYGDAQTGVAELAALAPRWSMQINAQDPVGAGIQMGMGFPVGVRCATGMVLVLTNAGATTFTGRLAVNMAYDLRAPFRY